GRERADLFGKRETANGKRKNSKRKRGACAPRFPISVFRFPAYRFLSMNLTNSLRGIAPRTRSATSPFLNRMKVGIEVTMYFIATAEDSSTLILATLIFPTYCVARSSTIGATERQGPHQGAQKSTRTGFSLFKMSPSKLASETV